MAARVVALSPGDANFEDTYAWALYVAGDFGEALTWIELALFHEGERPSATVLEHAGDILQGAGPLRGGPRKMASRHSPQEVTKRTPSVPNSTLNEEPAVDVCGPAARRMHQHAAA